MDTETLLHSNSQAARILALPAGDRPLPPKMLRFLRWYIRGESKSWLLEHCKIKDRTYCTWMSDPRIVAALRQYQALVIDEVARETINGGRMDGIPVLREIARDETAQKGTRVSAASKLCDGLWRMVVPDGQASISVTQTVEADHRKVQIQMMEAMAGDPELLAARATIAEREAKLLAEARGKTGRAPEVPPAPTEAP